MVTELFGSPGLAPPGALPVQLQYKVLASETKEGQERERTYYEALGRFVQIFAEVERIVWLTLVSYVEARLEIAKIVLTAGKVAQCATHIKQIAAATNAPREKRHDLEFIFNQLGIINGVRDLILHYGATSIAEGKGTVSNAWKAKAEPQELPISADALLAMTDDLRKIIAHLAYRHLGQPRPKGALSLGVLDEVLARPWRYKFPEQTKKQSKKWEGQPIPKPHSKQPRQQRSSRE